VIKRLQKTYGLISLLSAGLAITVQSWVYGSLMRSGYGIQPSFWVNLLTASTVYVVIYRVLIKVYEVWGWRMIHRRYLIEGVWYHEFLSDTHQGYRRLGVTEISQTFNTIEFSAQNYDADFSQSTRTMWRSRAVQIDDNGWVTVAYQAHRARPGQHDSLWSKEGLMYFQIRWDEHNRPIGLVGTYADSFPSDHRGCVTLLRKTPWSREFNRIMSGKMCKDQFSGEKS